VAAAGHRARFLAATGQTAVPVGVAQPA
jgi:hypothetical protein